MAITAQPGWQIDPTNPNAVIPITQFGVRNLQFQSGDPGAILMAGREQARAVGQSSNQQFGTLLLELLKRHQQLGTRGFAEQELGARQAQAGRISAQSPQSLIGASPQLQASARSAFAGALQPTISGAEQSQQTYGEQIKSFGDTLGTARDILKDYESQQDNERDDARSVVNQALTLFGSRGFDVVDQKFLKLSGYDPKTVSLAKETLRERELEIKQQTAALTKGLTLYQQTQTFNGIVNAYNKSPLVQASDRTPVLKSAIENIRKNPSNGALQLNLAYSYIQALDTYQSAVREGELALVNSIESKVGQVQGWVQQIQNGQLVRPEVAKQLAAAAEQVLNTISQAASQKAQSFEAQADVAGVGSQWDAYIQGFQPSYTQPSGGASDWEYIPDNAPSIFQSQPTGSIREPYQ